MQANALSSRMTPEFTEAIKDPLLPGISKEVLGRSFAHLPAEERDKLVQENMYALLGRRIANFLANLPTSPTNPVPCFATYGNYVNSLGQLLAASILQVEKVAQAESYIQRVQKAMLQIFQHVEANRSLSLKDQNVYQELKPVDVPEGQWAKAINLLENHEDLAQAFAEYYTNASLYIDKWNETTSGTSLRGKLDPEKQKEIIEFIKELVLKSGLIKFTDQLKLTEESFFMILEGKEIHNWVNKEALDLELTDEQLARIQTKSAETITKEAVKIVFENVQARMKQYIEEHPTVDLDLQELMLFFIQDFYLKTIGVKSVLRPDFLNQIRSVICPKIADIQFPRVTHLRIALNALQPFATTENKVVDLISYLEYAQTLGYGNRRQLQVAITQLKRDNADQASKSALQALEALSV